MTMTMVFGTTASFGKSVNNTAGKKEPPRTEKKSDKYYKDYKGPGFDKDFYMAPPPKPGKPVMMKKNDRRRPMKPLPPKVYKKGNTTIIVIKK